MKKSFNMLASALVVFSFTVLGGCKNKEAAEETEFSADTIAAPAPDVDSTQMAPVNDSNVGGVTGGKMEQVP